MAFDVGEFEYGSGESDVAAGNEVAEGVELLNAIQDVYLSDSVTVA